MKTILLLLCFSAEAIERPPQFVNLAFDGSKSLKMWQKTTAFAKAEDLKFTYFISGVYFLAEKDTTFYDGPRVRAGRSAIGFGGKKATVTARNSWVQASYKAGHEIASHANGHYDGTPWSLEEWSDELRQFENILMWSRQTYKGASANTWQNGVIGNLIGFRAPLLGRNDSMFKALRNNGYTYDTSRVRSANHWPKKLNGVWDFPLASLRMAYSNKRTLSMDYNMYVAQSKGKRGDKSNFEKWENEVYETYLQYFKANYLGNRAPLDIGHHFSLWNGGIYWRAMQRFARTVCSEPEVICGTYTDMYNFLEGKTASQIKEYQSGNFPKISTRHLSKKLFDVKDVTWVDEVLTPEIISELEAQACPPEAH